MHFSEMKDLTEQEAEEMNGEVFEFHGNDGVVMGYIAKVVLSEGLTCKLYGDEDYDLICIDLHDRLNIYATPKSMQYILKEIKYTGKRIINTGLTKQKHMRGVSGFYHSLGNCAFS